MAIIYTYPISPPVGTDLLVGTRSGVPRNPTRNFSVDQLAVYIIDNLNGANLTVPIFFDTVNPTTGLVETTLVDSILTQDANPGGTTLTIAGNISITGTLADSNASVGTNGQVLTSTVTGIAWADNVQATFEFTQGVPATTWNITHNLNKFPSITVIDTGNTVVTGEYNYTSKNTVTLTFSAAFAGKAYLN